MRDNDRRAPFHEVFERLLNGTLTFCVERAGCLVQQQDRRILEYRPCDGNALPLTAREACPAFTEERIVALGQLANELVGRRGLDLPLEGLESIEIDGKLYEAFNTSGGLGSLADSWRGRVGKMNYKTMRYPGHCHQMRLLMNGLKLNHDRDTLKRILENSVPRTLQDVVVVYVSVTGITGERSELPPELLDDVAWLREQTDLPICIGFGISGPETAARLAAVADGWIGGSAIVRRVAEAADQAAATQAVTDFIGELRRAMDAS